MSAATTAASRRSGPGTSISWIPSARILADARLLPKLVMTFAGPWFAQQPPEGASNGEGPILPMPYDGVTSGSTSRSFVEQEDVMQAMATETFIGNMRGPVIRPMDA